MTDASSQGSENAEALSPEFVGLVASVCHAANAAYCRSLGDDSQPAWADAPDWQRTSAMNGVRFHVANPDAGDSASHDSWVAEKVADGWVYGEIKDPEKKTHPCIVPFDQLPPAQQFKDTLFRTLVHSLAPQLEAAAHNFTEIEGALDQYTSKVGEQETEIAALTAERDTLAAKVAKADAEPKVRKSKAGSKPRKCGPMDDQPRPEELLELIGMAQTVEVVFSDGEKELPFERRMIDGPAWAMTAVGLQLRLPEFVAVGPATGPVNLAGYGLFLDGSQVAYAPRMDVLDVQPGRRMDLRNDVVFRAA